jgi:Fe-S-cluster-containing dehydrogenase component
MKHYGVVIDTDRCIGCQTCIVGCHVDHELPDGIYWGKLETVDSPIVYKPTGKYPNVKMRSRTLMCNHCEKPECVKNCPTNSMRKRADGIVFVNFETCIGCGICRDTCPYDVPVLDEELGQSNKCNLCFDRVDRGNVPFCVQSCPTQARIFGDLNDKNSEAAKLVASGKTYRLKPEAGTGSSLYYLGK